MTGSVYHFITGWQVKSSVEEIYEVLANGPDLVRWWPSVYLDVEELAPGGENKIGLTYALHTKGWLPYTLRWQLCLTENRKPDGFAFEASGDLVGRGIWMFEQKGEWVRITYDWKIRPEKPLLRILSPVLKPVFALNHNWAMRKGEKSLKLEMARRHAANEAQRARLPAPPGPTTSSPLPLTLFAGAAFLAARWVLARLFRRR